MQPMRQLNMHSKGLSFLPWLGGKGLHRILNFLCVSYMLSMMFLKFSMCSQCVPNSTSLLSHMVYLKFSPSHLYRCTKCEALHFHIEKNSILGSSPKFQAIKEAHHPRIKELCLHPQLIDRTNNEQVQCLLFSFVMQLKG